MLTKADEKRASGILGNTLAWKFLSLATQIDVGEANELAVQVDEHVTRVKQAASKGGVDLALAALAGKTCKVLLSQYMAADARSKAAILAAVRYFVDADDLDNDLTTATGFRDDARVINFVIELLAVDAPQISLD